MNRDRLLSDEGVSFFPIRVEYRPLNGRNEVETVDDPADLLDGVPFVVLQTRVNQMASA